MRAKVVFIYLCIPHSLGPCRALFGPGCKLALPQSCSNLHSASHGPMSALGSTVRSSYALDVPLIHPCAGSGSRATVETSPALDQPGRCQEAVSASFNAALSPPSTTQVWTGHPEQGARPRSCHCVVGSVSRLPQQLGGALSLAARMFSYMARFCS